MKHTQSILIVEDEDIIRETMHEFLVGEGFRVEPVGGVEAALNISEQMRFDLAICDVQLPDGDGVDLLRQLKQSNSDLSGLIITAYATVENAVDAFKSGAIDYLVKPVLFEELLSKIERLFEVRHLHIENQTLRRELQRRGVVDRIVGSSKVLRELQHTIRKVAVTNSNVLLCGESGTGKELVARAIHKAGPHSEQRFVAVNCGTRPIESLEAQLFGSVSADHPHQIGALRHVHEGTVFLDEVSQLPLGIQSELLRAIEYQEIMPVGGSEVSATRARILVSSTRDLAQEVADGRFQEDLFYRLDGVKLRVPPLRERLDDIPELTDFFVAKHARAMGKTVTGATSETIRLLLAVEWLGNVRQLDNAVERAVMMCDGERIEAQDLPPDLLGIAPPAPDANDLRSALRHYEQLHITRVLRQWPDKREAAKRLKLGLSSLYRKIEDLGIDL